MTESRQGWTSKGLLIAALSAVVLALGALMIAPGQATDDIAATVEMTDALRFDPGTVTIQSGETVTWRNSSQVAHTVTADPDLAGDPSNVQLPEGAQTFDSGNIAPGDSYSRTFDVPGTYEYICIPHEAQGMTGTLVVK